MTDDLDTAARAFAAADLFDREAAELRSELRRLRAAGRVAPSWGRRWEAPPDLPDALPRIAVEAAFLIAAAVFVGVGGFGAVTVVAAMAAAWLVVCGVEWAARRERRAAELVPDGEDAFLDALRPDPPTSRRSSSLVG